MINILKYKTKNFYREIEEILQDLGTRKIFLDLTPKAWCVKGKAAKLDLKKNLKVALQRRWKECKKIFAKHISKKGPVARIYKGPFIYCVEFQNSTLKIN